MKPISLGRTVHVKANDNLICCHTVTPNELPGHDIFRCVLVPVFVLHVSLRFAPYLWLRSIPYYIVSTFLAAPRNTETEQNGMRIRFENFAATH